MPKASIVKAGLMKTCSACPRTYVGNRLVEEHFGKNKRNPDNYDLQCKHCKKKNRETRRAPGKAYLAARKNLTGCENPLCECTPKEREKRESEGLEFHHLEPQTKKFNLAHGLDKPLGQQIDEAHLTICICKWSHDKTKGYRGLLTEYGKKMANAHAQRLSRYKAEHSIGTMTVEHKARGQAASWATSARAVRE